jgi:dienelactone hydrolase
MCAPPGRWNWLDYARHISERGYMALAYDYRGMGESDTGPIFNRLEYDLRAAIEFVTSRGAERVILAGGSCGGASSLYMSIKEPQKVAGLIVLASSRYGTGLSVTTEDLAALRVPKLFISTELDPVTFSTLDLYDQTPEPKEKHIYPSSTHGTDLFFTEHRDDLTARMTAFIEKHVPAR